MRRVAQLMLVVAFMALSLGTTPLWAHHFQRLSRRHILFGVSQLLVGNIPIGGFFPLKLMNPNHLPHVAAVMVYESERGMSPGIAEVFLGCVVEELTPHASVGIRGEDLPDRDESVSKYVEVISAPREKVKGKRRLLDGLGIVAESTSGHQFFLVHPELFSLPSDDVDVGQRQAAIVCVCNELDRLGLDPRVFKGFGVSCAEPEEEDDDDDDDD